MASGTGYKKQANVGKMSSNEVFAKFRISEKKV